MYPQSWMHKKKGLLYGPRGHVGFSPYDPAGEDEDALAQASTPGTGHCPWSRDTDVKPYWFLNSKGEILETIAKNWLGDAWMQGTTINTTRALMKANADLLDGNCNWLRNGVNIIRIPKLWPAPPVAYKDQIVNADGTKYVFTGDEGDDNVIPGTEGVDRINVTDGDSGVLTWVLIGGAAIAAAVIGMKVVGKKRR